MSWRPACPNCSHPIQFHQAQWRRGRAFPCRRCGAALILPKAGLIAALAAVLLLIFLLRGLRTVSYGWLLVALVFTVLVVAEYLLVDPKCAKPEP